MRKLQATECFEQKGKSKKEGQRSFPAVCIDLVKLWNKSDESSLTLNTETERNTWRGYDPHEITRRLLPAEAQASDLVPLVLPILRHQV